MLWEIYTTYLDSNTSNTGIHVASVIREMAEWLSIQIPVIRVFMSTKENKSQP